MNVNSLGKVARLIGEAGRIQMLAALLDGNSHSAAELALAAGASPQTASSHLSKLLAGGLIVSERRGRQRLFRFKSTEVAVAVEALGALVQKPCFAQKQPTPAMPELRMARTCYDHLAGALAIALRNELLRKDVLRHRGDEFLLTDTGELFLRKLDIDAEPLRGLRRAFARKCMDWTERHHHVGGAVGAALLSRFLEKKWLAQIRDTRAVRVTHEGERGFERVFTIRCSALRSQADNS